MLVLSLFEDTAAQETRRHGRTSRLVVMMMIMVVVKMTMMTLVVVMVMMVTTMAMSLIRGMKALADGGADVDPLPPALQPWPCKYRWRSGRRRLGSVGGKVAQLITAAEQEGQPGVICGLAIIQTISY